MILFLYLAGATALALSFLLVPLLRPTVIADARVPTTHWRTALTVALAIPLLAFTLYVGSGRPFDWLGAGIATPHAQMGDLARMNAMTDELARRLQAQPESLENWLLLARSYQGTGRSAEALKAYAQAASLAPDDSDLLVEYANALSRQQGRSLAGQPTELIERALALAPDNLNALALAGAAALQRGEAQVAQAYWLRLRERIPAGSEDYARIEALLARIDNGERSVPTAAPAPVNAAATKHAATSPASIDGVVRVSPELSGRIAPGDSLFILARVAEGSSLPIAVVRKQAADWPVSFILDDGSAMMQDRALSAFETVELLARVSHTGNPAPQAGDIEGSLKSVAVGATGVELVLDRVVSDP
ncbi:tetratricopeptide repeat protein [Allopusillimonas ginsengisoli]|uniref:tetratricopeptide repeat protein n=1 Tax=Allopusillimonas ginsengisoli TaxID=453575 RepID=UPI00101EF9AB|nr:tetratricopeptide repeat protein [Allopusillimonas ginsengisoli]TEA78983.1 hypothetical protein ERE07_06180 [Allopusillimonas ginsengisoli]